MSIPAHQMNFPHSFLFFLQALYKHFFFLFKIFEGDFCVCMHFSCLLSFTDVSLLNELLLAFIRWMTKIIILGRNLGNFCYVWLACHCNKLIHALNGILYLSMWFIPHTNSSFEGHTPTICAIICLVARYREIFTVK